MSSDLPGGVSRRPLSDKGQDRTVDCASDIRNVAIELPSS